MRYPVPVAAALLAVLIFVAGRPAGGDGDRAPIFPVSPAIGDERLLTMHLDQSALEHGALRLERILAHGKFLFDTVFTELDGVSRPNHNGVFPPSLRTPRLDADKFNRISGPDADSCSGCHSKPRVGGGGDNVANVFVLGQRFSFFSDPTQPDENGLPAPGTLHNAADERNTLGVFGAGAIEMLAREMTGDLHRIRDRALREAKSSGSDVTLSLDAKGVNFGAVTGRPDGSLVTSGVQGVNADLIIRPFHQKGVAVSLREFTNNAFPHHHGLQPVERFGVNTDTDGDGVTNELSVGDITAATLFQAALAVPGQVVPRNRAVSAAIAEGEQLFRRIGCAGCHVPEMRLNSLYFTEPNPFNPPFNLRPQDVKRPVRLDLTREGELPRPEAGGGGVIVRAFTDLKRHNMGTHPLINNETVVQGGVPTNVFITKKLWGFASEPHFLHNGRATTIRQAIESHGGEAEPTRAAFAGLPEAGRRRIIEFLKSLRVLPAGTRWLVVDEFGHPNPHR